MGRHLRNPRDRRNPPPPPGIEGPFIGGPHILPPIPDIEGPFTGDPDIGIPGIEGPFTGDPDIGIFPTGGNGGGGTPPILPNFNLPPADPSGSVGGGTRGSGSDFLSEIMALLSARLQGPFGLPEDQLQRAENAINEQSSVGLQRDLGQLSGLLNASGQLGGGQFDTASQRLIQSSDRTRSNAQQSLGLQNALFANQGREQAFGSALGAADLELRGGLGGRSLDIQDQLGNRDLDIRELLGTLGIDLQRELGLGRLDLGQQEMDLFLQQFLAMLGLQTRQQNFLELLGFGG